MHRIAGVSLVAASAMFWLSWALMPGVGVTDTATIFALVGAHRTRVLASVVLQLLSAAAYAPGVVAIGASREDPLSRVTRAGCVLLAIGAMGSAADAIFHLVAYEMTDPSVVLDVVAPVMRRLQGPDLALLLPFIAAFFVGHALLVAAHRSRGPLERTGFRVLLAAPFVVLVGGPAARLGIVGGRVVGLAFLAAVAASLATTGLSIAASERGPQRAARRRG